MDGKRCGGAFTAWEYPGIMTAELYGPVLQAFMMTLPHTYREVVAPAGTVLHFTVTGEGGGDWYLTMDKKWELTGDTTVAAVAHTVIDGAVAWKLFTKSWRRKHVKDHVTVQGDQQLGGIILEMISVMA